MYASFFPKSNPMELSNAHSWEEQHPCTMPKTTQGPSLPLLTVGLLARTFRISHFDNIFNSNNGICKNVFTCDSQPHHNSENIPSFSNYGWKWQLAVPSVTATLSVWAAERELESPRSAHGTAEGTSHLPGVPWQKMQPVVGTAAGGDRKYSQRVLCTWKYVLCPRRQTKHQENTDIILS